MKNININITKNEEMLNDLFNKHLRTQELVWALREARVCLLGKGDVIAANVLTPQIKKEEMRRDILNEQIWNILDKDKELYDLYLKYIAFMNDAREEGRKPQEHYFN